MAYQHYQGPGMAGAPVSRDFLWQVFQRSDFLSYSTIFCHQLLQKWKPISYISIHGHQYLCQLLCKCYKANYPNKKILGDYMFEFI